MDQRCPWPLIGVHQSLWTDVNPSDGGFSSLLLHLYGRMVPSCTRRWPYGASSICIEAGCIDVSRLGGQERCDSVPDIVHDLYSGRYCLLPCAIYYQTSNKDSIIVMKVDKSQFSGTLENFPREFVNLLCYHKLSFRKLSFFVRFVCRL